MALLCSLTQLATTKKAACGRKRKITQFSDLCDFDIKSLEKENKEVRAAMLKQRYADMIFKSEQLLVVGVKGNDEQIMKKQKQFWEEKDKLKHSQREKEREAARIAIESVKRTVDFDDNLKAEREILIMIGEDQFDEQREKNLWEEIQKAKLKLKLQREREAARIALENMKRTVYFGEDMKAEKEFLMLIGAVKKVKC